MPGSVILVATSHHVLPSQQPLGLACCHQYRSELWPLPKKKMTLIAVNLHRYESTIEDVFDNVVHESDIHGCFQLDMAKTGDMLQLE